MKIGLVVEGGGMKCAYSAGVLDAFLESHLHFDLAIGVSGGAGNVASFLAGQRGRNYRFYAKYTNDPEFFGLKSYQKTGNLFGLQYIYGTITNSTGKDPIDYSALMNNTTDYIAVATDAQTAKPTYFTKEDMSFDDYRIFMASSAIPAVCKPVEIQGRKYYDGGISDSIPVLKALEQGCEKVVVILSKPRDYVRKPQKSKFIYRKACRKYPRIIQAIKNRHKMYNQQFKRVFELEKEGKVFVFAPESNLKIGTYKVDAQVTQQLYEMGIEHFYKKEKDFLHFLDATRETV